MTRSTVTTTRASPTCSMAADDARRHATGSKRRGRSSPALEPVAPRRPAQPTSRAIPGTPQPRRSHLLTPTPRNRRHRGPPSTRPPHLYADSSLARTAEYVHHIGEILELIGVQPHLSPPRRARRCDNRRNQHEGGAEKTRCRDRSPVKSSEKPIVRTWPGGFPEGCAPSDDRVSDQVGSVLPDLDHRRSSRAYPARRNEPWSLLKPADQNIGLVLFQTVQRRSTVVCGPSRTAPNDPVLRPWHPVTHCGDFAPAFGNLDGVAVRKLGLTELVGKL